MAPPTPPYRAAWTHPSLPLLPSIEGTVAWDDWECCGMFYPDPPHHAALLSLYGYEPEAGLYLEGATVVPLP